MPGVGPELARDIQAKAWSIDPELELAKLAKMGARVVTLGDEEYPSFLGAIYAPPPILYVRGSLAGCASGGVAVVGARKASLYGLKVARGLGRDLARAGISLVSGLARGIDAAAHTGALDEGGHSVGVLGCGLNVPYPRDNLRLASELAKQGARDQRVSPGHPAGRRQLPGAQPHYLGPEPGGGGGGGGHEERLSDNRPPCPGPGPGGVRGARAGGHPRGGRLPPPHPPGEPGFWTRSGISWSPGPCRRPRTRTPSAKRIPGWQSCRPRPESL